VTSFYFRNGHSKGIAFIEYSSADDARNAVQKTDNSKIGNKVISVAISNPPARKTGQDPVTTGHSREEKVNQRKERVSLVPRALALKSVASSNGEKVTKKSNDEFRAMLMGKKD